MKCDNCGREFGFIEDGNKLPTKDIDEIPKVYCDKCYEQWLVPKKEKEVKEELSESQLTIPEMQVNYLKEIGDDINSIRNDVHFIYIVVLINVIIIIILFLVSLFGGLAVL